MDVRLGTDALAEAVAAVRRTEDSLAATRSRAAVRVEALLDGGWSGRAADAFASAWWEWLDGAAVVARGLADTGEALAATDRDLAASDLTASDRSSLLADRLR